MPSIFFSLCLWKSVWLWTHLQWPAQSLRTWEGTSPLNLSSKRYILQLPCYKRHWLNRQATDHARLEAFITIKHGHQPMLQAIMSFRRSFELHHIDRWMIFGTATMLCVDKWVSHSWKLSSSHSCVVSLHTIAFYIFLANCHQIDCFLPLCWHFCVAHWVQ